MKTAFTTLLGIDLPVVGAPMFIVSGVDLVVAVSEAGGLGTLPSLNARSSEEFSALLDAIEAKTDKPYGINLILKDNPRLEADLQVCLAHRPAALITSLGKPEAIVKAAHAKGVKVLSDVTNERHAERAVHAGVDALVAVCAGAGGHAGAISPFVLLPLLAERFAVPVLAAGGIVDGRGLAAALALGAAGAYIGTRLVASDEALTDPAYLQAVIDAGSTDVEYTAEVTGVPANFLRVSLDAMRRGDIGKEKRFKHIWSAGQDVALIAASQAAGDIVIYMVREAEALLKPKA